MESRMADLSEQQVTVADALASTKVDHEEGQRKAIRDTVDSLLDGVSQEDRVLLMLKEVEGLSLKELGKIYDVNENALKVRLFRARQRVLKAFRTSRKTAAGLGGSR
jgi:RNA polymerase sigma-70 factor (ECF subfamily)